MKNTQITEKAAIISAIISGNAMSSERQYNVLDTITSAIWWAWENWDADILAAYYEGEKPAKPTQLFIEEWVNNSDFEADFGGDFAKDVNKTWG